ncbi:MAG: ferritin-like domain-containing protein [Gemmatimonadota bacterium]
MEPRNDLLSDDPELLQRLLTRREAIRSGLSGSSRAAAGLVLGSAPVALAVVATDALGQDDLPDLIVNVLNFALMLEELEAEFYTRGFAAPGLLRGAERETFDQVRKHEVAHVRFLRSVLGGRAIPKPTFDYTGGMGSGNGPFADVFSNPRTFAALAQAFEDTGVRAYKGQASFLMGNKRILEDALKIHAVEARHAAQIRRLRGQKGWIVQSSRGDLPPQTQPIYAGESNTFHFVLGPLSGSDENTRAFDEPLTQGEVMDIVRPFLATGR